MSVFVQASPSLQAVPVLFTGFEQAPVEASQVPATWHWSCAEQMMGFPPMHAPPWHVSVWVHASESSQVEESFFAGFEHVPVELSHVPATWHWSCAVQTTGFPPLQEPPWQLSPVEQASPSVQEEPSG